MKWIEFIGQRIATGDLLYLKKNGLCVVQSPYTTNEPGRIEALLNNKDSISFSDDQINSRNRNEYGDSFISKSGKIMRAIRYGGDYIDTILFICKVKPPK